MKNIFYKTLKRLIIFDLIIFIIGCVSYDVTNDFDKTAGYKKNEIYIVKKDIAIADQNFLFDSDVIVKGFYKGSLRKGFKGIIKCGEQIQIVRIICEHHPNVGNTTHPIAVILEGKWKNETVDLSLISKKINKIDKGKHIFDVLTNDPFLLQKNPK